MLAFLCVVYEIERMDSGIVRTESTDFKIKRFYGIAADVAAERTVVIHNFIRNHIAIQGGLLPVHLGLFFVGQIDADIINFRIVKRSGMVYLLKKPSVNSSGYSS